MPRNVIQTMRWEGENEWRNAKLIELANLGVSAGQIAVQIGGSRNAIIGRARRLGVELKAKSACPVRRPKIESAEVSRVRAMKAKAKIVAKKPVARMVEIKPERPAAPVAHKTIIELDFMNDCRWPIGEPKTKEFRYCGQPRLDPGNPSPPCAGCYCEFHTRLSGRAGYQLLSQKLTAGA